MRRVNYVLSMACALALTSSCQQGATPPTAPATPSAAPTNPVMPNGIPLALSPNAQLGGYQQLGDLSNSALALWDVTIDTSALSGFASLRESRSGQANDDLYLLSIGAFLQPDSFKISSVTGGATTLDIGWTFTHPFPAPANPQGTPNGSTNRADLGISGMVMPLIDVTSATGKTYFTDRVANTSLIVNADAYSAPAGLLTLSGAVANVFPYQSIVSEAGTGTRVGISNSNAVVGNYGTDGWTRAELGGGAPFDKWTGYGVLHGGQASKRSFSLDRAQLSATPTLNFVVAVLAKYNDPRQGANAATKRSHRLPPASPDASIFGYRMPHGALDVSAIRFEGASGPGFLTNQISASTLAFHVEDWDARATVTTATDLSLDPVVTTVAPGEAGLPDLAVSIPGVLGATTVIDDWNPATDVVNDDSASGGDAALDSGIPGDALFYRKSVTKVAGVGQTDGFYMGMVRATDVESTLPTALVTPLDGITLAPLSANLPQPVTYQAFRVIMTGTAGGPVLALTTPANVQSATTTTITVTGAFDPNAQTINVAIDWDNDTIFEDNRTIASPYTVPITWIRPASARYNNPSLTPSLRTIPVRFNDGVNPNVTYAPALTFTLGPNRPPVVMGSPGLQLSSVCRPSPATFTITRTGLTITDPEADAITFTVLGTPDAGAAITTSNIGAFPFSGAAAGPYTNPSATEVVFAGWANDATHTGIGGTQMPTNLSPLTGVITGNVGFVKSWGASDNSTDFSQALGIDSARNIYVGGNYGGTIDFDPGPGVATRNQGGLYVNQLNPVGNFKRVITWQNSPSLSAMQVSSAGDIYIAGTCSSNVDFDPGPGTAPGPSGVGYSVLRLDPAGNLVWSTYFVPPGGGILGGMSLDSAGRLLLVGGFNGTTDFDPGPGTAIGTSAGPFDAYALRLRTSDGSVERLRTWGGPGQDWAPGVTCEPSGATYVYGRVEGPIDVDPGPGVVTRTHSPTFAFAPYILKLDSDLDYVWDASFDIDGEILTIDSENNTAVYVGGRFKGSGDFDVGAGTATRTAGTSYDAFVVRYSSAGSFGWADTVGSTGTQDAIVWTLEVGETQVWAAGKFEGSMDFDPGVGTFNMTATPHATNEGDFMLWRLNAIPGTLNSAVSWGNGQAGAVFDLQFGGCSTFLIHMTGGYVGTADFDPGAPVVTATSLGGADAFLQQIRGDILTF